MDDVDRTAIYEVMEQQTVSIAKASITTTLNARTAILAAANPLYGRYNKRKTVTENVNLPAALLSRFDLLFLILDKHDRETDRELARHITYVHMHNKHPDLGFEPLSSEFIRYYVSKAKEFQPYIPKEVASSIVETYVEMRQNDKRTSVENGERALMTARQLLSILRLSQAHARLRFSNRVDHCDVEEAIRLVEASKSSLSTDEDSTGAYEDVVSRIYSIIRDYAANRNLTSLNYSDIEPLVLQRGFKKEQLLSCIQEYQETDVWQWTCNKTKLEFVNL
jgi:DNA replication licensing factor MCM7